MSTPLTTRDQVAAAEQATVQPVADLLGAAQQLVNATLPPEDLTAGAGAATVLAQIAAAFDPLLASVIGLPAKLVALAALLESVLPIAPRPVLTSISPASFEEGTSAQSFDLVVASVPSDWSLVLTGLPGVTIGDAMLTTSTNIRGHINVAAGATVGSGTIYINSPTAGDSLPVSLSVVTPVMTGVTPNTIAQGATNIPFTVPGANFPTDAVLVLTQYGQETGVTINDYTRVSSTQITGHMSATATATISANRVFQMTSATAGPSNYVPLTVTAAAAPTGTVAPYPATVGSTISTVPGLSNGSVRAISYAADGTERARTTTSMTGWSAVSSNPTLLSVATIADGFSTHATQAGDYTVTITDPYGATCVASVHVVNEAAAPTVLNGVDPYPGLTLPGDSEFRRDISAAPVASNDAALKATISAGATVRRDFGSYYSGLPWGVQLTPIPANQATVTCGLNYASDSDAPPYPIPANVKIQNDGLYQVLSGNDHRAIILDNAGKKSYELYNLWRPADPTNPVPGGWYAGSEATFRLDSNRARADGKTTNDAAGTFMAPLLLRYDEVLTGTINHVLCCTFANIRLNAHVWPGRHNQTDGIANAPIYGQRLRLKASKDISGFAPFMQVIFNCMKSKGVMVVDEGGEFSMSGIADERWPNQLIGDALAGLNINDFEFIEVEASNYPATAILNSVSATSTTSITLSVTVEANTSYVRLLVDGAYVGDATVPGGTAGTYVLSWSGNFSAAAHSLTIAAVNARGVSGADDAVIITVSAGSATPATMKFVPLALNAPTAGTHKVTPEVRGQSGNVIVSPVIHYAIADTSIATVDADGTVHGVVVGETTATVTCGTLSQTVKVQIFDAVTGAGIMGSTGPAPFYFDSISRYADNAALSREISPNVPNRYGGHRGTGTGRIRYSDGLNGDLINVVDNPDLGTVDGFGRCFKLDIVPGTYSGDPSGARSDKAAKLYTYTGDAGASGSITGVVIARRILMPIEFTAVGEIASGDSQFKFGPIAFWVNGARFSIYYDGDGNNGKMIWDGGEGVDSGDLGGARQMLTSPNNTDGSAGPVMGAGTPYDTVMIEQQFLVGGTRYWEAVAYCNRVGTPNWEQWGPRLVAPFGDPTLRNLGYWSILTGLETYNDGRTTPLAWYITEPVAWDANLNPDPLGCIAQTASHIPDTLWGATARAPSGSSCQFDVTLARYAGSLRAKVNGAWVAGQDYVIPRTQPEQEPDPNYAIRLMFSKVTPTLTGLPSGTNTILWFGVSRDGTQVSAVGASCQVTIAGAPPPAPNYPAQLTRAWEADSGRDVSAEGAGLGIWADAIGGKQWTQATSANKPILRLNALNGLPVLEFDGSQWMDGIKTALGLDTIDGTIYVVVAPSTVPNYPNKPTILDNTGANNTGYKLRVNDSSNFDSQVGNGGGFDSPLSSGLAAYTVNTWSCITVEMNHVGNYNTLGFKGRTNTGSGNAPYAAQSGSNPTLGADQSHGSAFQGRIAAIYFAPTASTGATIDDVWNYINTKWGVIP